jgi:hypothetical protein
MTQRTKLRDRRHRTNAQSPRTDFRSLASAVLPLLFLLVTLLTLGRSGRAQNTDDKQADNRTYPSSIEPALARAQSAALERHYSEAIKILRAALKDHPGAKPLQLELGRTYLTTGEDRRAERLFREILRKDPGDRDAQLELARTLAYQRRYEQSDGLYRQLLAANPADEAAAIGLTSNLIHEGKKDDAGTVADAALRYHGNSLRLLEFKDRIGSGLLGGEERALAVAGNVFSTAADYVNDSAGNHSWRGTERVEYRIRPGLTSELHLEQQFLQSLDDPLEVVETFSETLRWRPLERLAVTAEGGAVHFDKKGDVDAIYEGSLTTQLASHFFAGAGFSRIPIVPDAEAAEHRLTAQGWEVFSLWTPARWQINLRASRRQYSDENVGARQSAEILHQWTTAKVNYTAGYRFRHYGFSQDVAHGYFSPDSYQSHQAVLGIAFRPVRRYRLELTGRAGAESIASGADFQSAWEITARNHLLLGAWELNLDYSRYNMAQVTGAFTADAARFELAYHF